MAAEALVEGWGRVAWTLMGLSLCGRLLKAPRGPRQLCDRGDGSSVVRNRTGPDAFGGAGPWFAFAKPSGI